jgi:oligogalacturonide lyase
VEIRRDTSRLRLVRIPKGDATTLVQADEPLSDPLPRPRAKAVLYRRGANSLWLAGYNGEQNRRLPLASGGLGPALWSPRGRTVFYLNLPEDRRSLHAIREFTPETNTDALVARTSQFVHFGQNANSSVFVGASNSKAFPYVLILLRTTRRELTLCEHRASDASTVAPVFSPESQTVYFQSDRDGKPAIYRIRVDKFVAKTES